MTGAIGAPSRLSAAPARQPYLTGFLSIRNALAIYLAINPDTRASIRQYAAFSGFIFSAMHEYLLYSQIPATRESQVLQLLAGVTAAQPVDVYEQTLIYAQQKIPEVAVNKKTKQPQQKRDPTHHKLVRDISPTNLAPGPWRIRIEETPEPGVQTLLSRGVTERVAENADLDHLKSSDWYQYKQQLTQIGKQFVQGNVVIRIVRYYTIAAGSTETEPLHAPLPAKDDLRLLDVSGGCVVQAVVRVENLSNSNITDKAKKELSAFQAYLEGAVNLSAPDRLALDTRVKVKA
ncbi:hypothetical protein B0A54_01286 [Lecanosticta acicola]|uniref:Mediator of RNA polymerase II transcription subunit 18 n=1 Tax=Lecanosticta acicola TaxID=111012 RepID=A0AAI8YZQ9_9PEZI|nr:hypothetical protein B0A54_01286 [Lecanosticta acicola]